ncbi:S-adenosyl-L-methionine-dependent methyltransferase [Byssothecium circinans]|uniref:S-adenosyl-L-methionine-dependent methyltransferase n=1 Tax=Byssothecium circinans TaxID=147558 RepID=A0A6A5TDT7_9PLEO|nr:S-adenosyl-L-methionine-dependent methyltransferase [Byssothecium circinans]
MATTNGSDTSSLLQLAEQLQSLTASVVSHLKQQNHPEPNFTPQSHPVPDDATYQTLRDSINDAAYDLVFLVNGPKMHGRHLACQPNDLAAHDTAFSFDFFNAFPVDGTITLSELSQKTGIDEGRAGRILRLLCARRWFTEVEKNTFAHTSVTAMIAQEPEIRSAFAYQLDEMFQASADLPSSIRNGATTPFEQRHGAPIFDFYKENLKMGARFTSAMSGIAKLDRQTRELKEQFAWSDLGEATVVDIGGGSGHVSMELARLNDSLKFTVQDSNKDMLEKGKAVVSEELKPRISYLPHDFFAEQPVQGADIYLFRQVLHNWGDEDVVKILKATLPALEKSKPNAKIIINDTILPEPGSTSRFRESLNRQIDIHLMVAFGSIMRTGADYARLLAAADLRFHVVDVYDRGSMGLVVAELKRPV